MAIISINQKKFNSLNPARNELVKMISSEKSWFSDTNTNIIGAVILDKTDNDWGNVILAKHEDGLYRYIDGQISLDSRDKAEEDLISVMSRIEVSGEAPEKLFESKETDNEDTNGSVLVTDINLELKRYFKNNPHKLYNLDPRKFEELIASIMEDLGFEVELTKATRDGGSDIIAYFRNSVCSYLTLVECKRYSPENKVGVGIIREVLGVHNLKRATKSIIVTTSFFSSDAQKEAKEFNHQLDLKDYSSIKHWLEKY